MTEPANGFLGRWARRKNDVLLGKPLTEPDAPAPLVAVAPVVSPVHGDVPVQELEPEPALSLDDVKLLTKDSDFKPFMAQNVGPDVRNAAMKKLFEDPHFNIMDGLDIYIDDYSISEPIPESMLRQMASAKFLNLFEDDEDEDLKKEPLGAAELTDSTLDTPETPDVSADQSVAHSPQIEPAQPTLDNALAGIDPSSQPEVPSTFVASQENHADSYLRLQPDHAPSAPEAGRSS
jgi:hypothetical protein